MSTENPLNTSGSVKLNGSGAGTVRIGPQVGQTWRLNIATVRVTTNTAEPQCLLYIGASATDDNLVDGTYSGSLDSTDSVAGYPITAGQYLIAAWSGGDANATATLSVLGTVETGRR